MTKEVKMRFFALLIFFLFVRAVYADVYVIHDTQTNEIVTLSSKDDTLPLEGQEKSTLKGDLVDYEFQYNPTYYKLINSKFIVNTAKIDTEYQTEQIEQEKAQELEMLEKKLKWFAITELKKEGKTFQYYDPVDYEQ